MRESEVTRWLSTGTVAGADREAVIEHEHTLDLTDAATAGTARAWRHRFEERLCREGAPPSNAEDLGHAVYEALANAVEHAYPADPPESRDPPARAARRNARPDHRLRRRNLVTRSRPHVHVDRTCLDATTRPPEREAAAVGPRRVDG